MYKTLYIGEDFISCCHMGAFGHVHSVFSRAINIRMKTGDLKSILVEKSDIMTAAATISAKDLNNFAQINDRVLFTPQMIYVNNNPKIYGIEVANLWSQDTKKIKCPVNSFHLLNTCYKIEKFLYEEDKYDCTSLSMIAKNHPLSYLIGLGSGLTPSGDDFICGILFVLSYMQKAYGKAYLPFDKMCVAIKENLHQTNEISIHFLSHALSGQMGKETQTLLHAIFCSKDDRTLFDALSRKKSRGASSGMDEICGIIHGIRLFLKEMEVCT